MFQELDDSTYAPTSTQQQRERTMRRGTALRRRRRTRNVVSAVLVVALVAGVTWFVAGSATTSQTKVPPAEQQQLNLHPADVSFVADARQLKPMPARLPDLLLVRIGYGYCDHLSQGGPIAQIITGKLGVSLNTDLGLDAPVSVPLGWVANEAVLAAAIHTYCPAFATTFDAAWRTPSRFLYSRPGSTQRARELRLIHRLRAYVNNRSN
jgi:hypothetical protein